VVAGEDRNADGSPADEHESPSSFTHQVGKRLRAVRHQQHLSLEEVEQRSGGRWSASAIGAYERGYRNLTLGRLRELADFYGVPMGVLLGEIDLRGEGSDTLPTRVVLDLAALERQADAGPVARYARAIALERGDFNGRVLSIRRDDIRILSALLDLNEQEFLQKLTSWNAMTPPARVSQVKIDLTTTT
jgi:transcriptional regulator with XRE-family HTH domain